MRNTKTKREHRKTMAKLRRESLPLMDNVRAFLLHLFDTRHKRPSVRGVGRSGHSIPWAGLLLIPLLFTGCGSLVEGFAPPDLDYVVEEGQPAKPVTPKVEPGVGPVNIDGKISEPVQSPAAECGPNGCRLPARAAGRVLEAAGDGPVRRVFSRQPVRRVFGACRFGRCG